MSDGEGVRPSLLPGLRTVAMRYDVFILDIWGVLHDGITPFSGTISCLQAIKGQGKKILLLSNTPDRSAPTAQGLSALGIDDTLYDHILTAGESAWLALKKRPDEFHKSCGMKCFLAGGDFETGAGLLAFVQGLDGIALVDRVDQADFILNACGGTRRENYGGMWKQVRQALACNLPMICTNPDLVVNVGNEQFLCAGSFAKFYEENGGRVAYHGKPHRPVYDMAFNLLGKPEKSRMLAIGDSLHTDIRGANEFGIDSIFCFSGIHGGELGTPEKRQNLLQGHDPTYLMRELDY